MSQFSVVAYLLYVFRSLIKSAHSDPWYFGPDRGTHRKFELQPECTFESAFRNIRDASEKGRVFVREHPFHLIPKYFTTDVLQMFRGSFLIRDPAYSFPSYFKHRPDFTEEEGGLLGLHKAWQMLLAAGEDLPIVDATDIQRDPKGYVGAWCDAMGLERRDDALHWDARMFKSWETWSEWVDAVSQSTGFNPPPTQFPEVKDERLAKMIDSSRPLYLEMAARKIVV